MNISFFCMWCFLCNRHLYAGTLIESHSTYISTLLFCKYKKKIYMKKIFARDSTTKKWKVGKKCRQNVSMQKRKKKRVNAAK